ncbi:MAG: 50S ribosomal protein L21 [Magnetococcales bacterium]|nr:50S ribosomal protein L21 [Magnetococcales bacterium]
MYAVVKTGGKQYRVTVNDILQVDRIPGDQGAEITLDEVLMVGGEEGEAAVGAAVAGKKVSATIMRQIRGKKILVFKKRRRKNYRRRKGHRSELTELKITAIQ